MGELKPRVVRVVDFLAEGLEEQAKRIPAGHPDAEHCLRLANNFRESKDTKMVRVWEEAPAKPK